MAVVALQVGQCGNQLGEALFEALLCEPAEAQVTAGKIAQGCHSFFRLGSGRRGPAGKPVARAILVDTEPKVLNRCLKRQRTWEYDQANVLSTGHGGAGNNWALGYGSYGRVCEKRVLDAVRREAERADAVRGFMVLHSVAGGTGSGLGAAITEQLQDSYPNTDRMNVVVCPYHAGEVIVQNYNAILTLSHLAAASDGIVFLENEHANRVCIKALRQPRPSLVDLNNVLSSHIASFLLPATQASGRPHHLRHTLSALCAHPGFNMMTCRLQPQTPALSLEFENESWGGILHRLLQMHMCGGYMDADIDWTLRKPVHGAVANMLTLRGPDWKLDAREVQAFRAPELYAAWSEDCMTVSTSRQRFQGHHRAAALVSNSQAILVPLERIATRARMMFEARAFVHQYAKHGVDTQDMELSFLAVDQVVRQYRDGLS